MNDYKGIYYIELYGKIYPKILKYKNIPIFSVYFTEQEFKEAIDRIDESVKEGDNVKNAGRQYLEFEWDYIENVKDLKKLIEALPDDTEVKKDLRLLMLLQNNKYILQFREHDFS